MTLILTDVDSLRMEWVLSEAQAAALRDMCGPSKRIDDIAKSLRVSPADVSSLRSITPSAPIFAVLSQATIAGEVEEVHKASLEFRAKTERLKKQFEHQAYKSMVQSVDASQNYGGVVHMENFGQELAAVNRQLMSVLNVLITVAGAFFFGFSGITYAYPHMNLDLATRFIVGLVLATIVFFADLYFVIKSMDESSEATAGTQPAKVSSPPVPSKSKQSKKDD